MATYIIIQIILYHHLDPLRVHSNKMRTITNPMKEVDGGFVEHFMINSGNSNFDFNKERKVENKVIDSRQSLAGST